MPHVIIEGPIDLEALHRSISPALERMTDGLRRLKNAYLDQRETTLLLETLVMEGGVGRIFLVRVDRKSAHRHSVRLDPIVSVDRTCGVIGAVAWVGRLILEQCPKTALCATNIQEFEGN